MKSDEKIELRKTVTKKTKTKTKHDCDKHIYIHTNSTYINRIYINELN